MSGFDRLARPYRWLEYLTFGRALERCRFHYLPQLANTQRALVLGDGDGRFAARLHCTQIHAVDASPAMLALLGRRCGGRAHLHTHDLATGLPAQLATAFDLVATHFFLDCLTTPQVAALAAAVRPRMAPNALWVVSEFAIPTGFARWPARAVIAALYTAFGLLTGLRTRQLPHYRSALAAQGLVLQHSHNTLCGLLTSELWRNPG